MIGSFLASIKDISVFLIVLSILVIVHEWGHFITARKLGVRVEKFSVGFGKKLWSKMRNGTEFLICLIPLGGYVKMAGDERDKCLGTSDEFYSKPPGHRALVILNGPVVNYVLAYICFVFVFMIGYPGMSTRVANVVKGSPAFQAGIQKDDKIIAIDHAPVYGWINMEKRLEGDSMEPLVVTVERNGLEQNLTVLPIIENKPDMLGDYRNVRSIGIDSLTNTIGAVIDDMPAQKAGLQQGDVVKQINGQEISSWDDLQEAINSAVNSDIIIMIERDGQLISETVQSQIKEVEGENGQLIEKKLIGIAPAQNMDLYRFSAFESVKYAYTELIYITKMTYKSLWRMVTGSMSAKENVTGPVGIFFIVKGAAQEGLSHLLFIMAVISASLAIFNLLPIIPLDGGHLFILAIEKIRGRTLSPKTEEYIARTGLTMILLLAVFVFYSDFDRFGIIDAVRSIF